MIGVDVQDVTASWVSELFNISGFQRVEISDWRAETLARPGHCSARR